MSILIKGLKMPNVCDECWALDESGDYPMCRITGETRGYTFRVREKRMDGCPLVELPDRLLLRPPCVRRNHRRTRFGKTDLANKR